MYLKYAGPVAGATGTKGVPNDALAVIIPDKFLQFASLETEAVTTNFSVDSLILKLSEGTPQPAFAPEVSVTKT
ncbi:hypothetical protein D3C86_1407380 [compost metagenome]